MDDLLDGLPDSAPKKSKRGPQQFDNPLDQTTRQAAVKATESGSSRTAGNYEQLNFRLTSNVIDKIFSIAEELGVSKEEAKRWLIDQGIANWDKGARPETEDVTVVRRITSTRVKR